MTKINASYQARNLVNAFGISSSTAGGGTSGTTTVASGTILLAAGSNITLSSSGGVITVIGAAAGTGGATFTLNASTGSVSLVAGANITLQSNASTITIVGGAGGGGGTFTLNATTNSVSISAGAGIGIGQAASTITISASPVAASNFSLNGTSNTSVSISAGAGIGIGQANSTITISASPATGVSGFGISSITAGGATSGTTSTATGTVLLAAGSNVTLSSSAGGITVIGPAVPSSVSLVAGAGISFSSNASTITILETAPLFAMSSITAGGATSGATNTAYSTLIQFVAGSNITLSQSSTSPNLTIIGAAGAAAGTNTISASGTSIAGTALSLAIAAGANISLQTATGVGSMTISISGENAVSPNGFASSTGTMVISGGPGIAISTGANSIQISNSNPVFSTISLSASGQTTGATSSGTMNNVLAFSGMGGVSIGVGNGTVSISGATGGGGAALTIKQTQNLHLEEIGLLTSTSGTITGTAGYGSSLFLQRIFIPGTFNFTEADLALGMSFNATSNGGGTLSRSLVVYSFGNSTSLASVASISGTSSWQTGTSTSGAVVSLTQFQGGWAGTNIAPMTFAATSLSAGEYVIGNLFNFAQASSTWSLSVYGGNVGAVSTAGVVTSVASSTTSYYSSIAQLAITNVENTATMASISGGTITTATTFHPNAAARTVLTASTTTGNNVTSISALTQTITFISTSTLPTFGFIGTGSTTSAFPFWFSAGVMSTGAIPVAITLTSAAVTYSGSTALIQPWFALAGS